jgi:hypothetical protein
MIVVIVALTLGSLLTIAALAAATGDLPGSRNSQDRKAAYAAAESGLDYYKYKLSLNNDLWKTCYSDARTVPGSNESYTITPLPANGQPACLTGTPEATMLDTRTGTFRIRVTGKAGNVKRSLIAVFRRRTFLDFIYYTTYETKDPLLYSDPTWAANNCVKVRAQRDGSCVNIQFASGDKINGPLHTDDDMLVCGGTTFGRQNQVPPDSIEVSGPSPGWIPATGGSCSGSPTWYGTLSANVKPLGMPSSNAALSAAANVTYYGTTTITLKDSKMDVSTYDANGTAQTYTDVDIPVSGVIYVRTGKGGCPVVDLPTSPNYTKSDGCANVYLKGTYATDLTIGSDKDIIVVGDVMRTRVNNVPADVMLGLIANSYVRVKHPVSNGSNVAPVMTNVTIEAAIMSVQHSFIVDNWDEGQQLGTLTVFGAIAQKFRGPVGTTGPTGYTKGYSYDDRMHYRNPPSFLDPVSAAWIVQRTNEQVPAT